MATRSLTRAQIAALHALAREFDMVASRSVSARHFGGNRRDTYALRALDALRATGWRRDLRLDDE